MHSHQNPHRTHTRINYYKWGEEEEEEERRVKKKLRVNRVEAIKSDIFNAKINSNWMHTSGNSIALFDTIDLSFVFFVFRLVARSIWSGCIHITRVCMFTKFCVFCHCAEAFNVCEWACVCCYCQLSQQTEHYLCNNRLIEYSPLHMNIRMLWIRQQKMCERNSKELIKKLYHNCYYYCTVCCHCCSWSCTFRVAIE